MLFFTLWFVVRPLSHRAFVPNTADDENKIEDA